ncbi:BRO family protein [Rhodococcus sp. NPDC003318]|uniref:BRO family protein n=1 Tax=Rhodococcus sp. NPDC003318 TaxID=3364503 RepID=UPI0036BEEB46
MSDLELFRYESTELRTVVIDSEPWFVATDVARILEYREAYDLTRRLDAEDKGPRSMRTPGGFQEVTIISEAGFYVAILGSKSARAKAVKRWLTHEVLPSIRKTGSYNTAPALTGPALMAAALVEAQQTLAAKDAQIALDAPKVAYHDEFVTDADLLSFRTVASTLDIAENVLRGVLIDRGWIYREQATRWSESKQCKETINRYSEYAHKKPYFRRVEEHKAPRFAGEVMHTLKITPAGAEAIARMVPRWTEGDAA